MGLGQSVIGEEDPPTFTELEATIFSYTSKPRQLASAFKAVLKLANEGDKNAWALVGFCNEFAIGTRNNREERNKAYRLAIEEGHAAPLAFIRICCSYNTPVALKRDCRQRYMALSPHVRVAFETKLMYSSHPILLLSLGQFYINSGNQAEQHASYKLFYESNQLGFTPAKDWLVCCYRTGKGTAVDRKKAFEVALELAKCSPCHGTQVAQMYINGEGCEKNYEAGMMWATIAAEAGSPTAMHMVASEYLSLSQNPHKELTRKYLRQAAERGYGPAMVEYSYFCDSSEMLWWLEKAASLDAPEAFFELGNRYRYGYDVAKDEAKAKELYERGAALGSLDCIFSLGTQLASNLRTYAAGMAYLRKAAGRGHAFSKAIIAINYFAANGIHPSDPEYPEHYRLLNAAAEANVLMAVEQLIKVELSANQRGGPNYRAAFHWTCKVVQGGKREEYAPKLIMFYYHGLGTIKDYEKAFELAEQLYRLNRVLSIYLPVMYENGHGTTKNVIKAAELYKVAAQAGDTEAMYQYGRCLEYGIGVTTDFILATFWYRDAADRGHKQAIKWLQRIGCSLVAVAEAA